MRKNRVLVLAASALASLQSGLILAQAAPATPPPPPPWGWYGSHMWGMGWGMWIFPLLMMLTFLVVAGMFIFGRGWRGGWHRGGPPWHMMDGPGQSWKDPTHSALQILNERYARGEIEKSEYEERKATILSGKQRA